MMVNDEQRGDDEKQWLTLVDPAEGALSYGLTPAPPQRTREHALGDSASTLILVIAAVIALAIPLISFITIISIFLE